LPDFVCPLKFICNLHSRARAVREEQCEQEESAADEATSPFEAPLGRFDALIALDSDMESVKPGMSGDAKINGPRRPLAVTVWQGFRDWFRSKVRW